MLQAHIHTKQIAIVLIFFIEKKTNKREKTITCIALFLMQSSLERHQKNLWSILLLYSKKPCLFVYLFHDEHNCMILFLGGFFIGKERKGKALKVR